MRILIALLVLGSCSSLRAQETNAVRMFLDQFDGGAHILATNTLPVVVSLRVSAELENAGSDYRLPGVFTVPAHSAVHIVTVEQKEAFKKWGLKWDYSFNLGDHRVKPDTNQVYQVPFKGRFRLTQGWFGKFSHHGWQRFAVDFTMPEGTDVCAARDGVVARTVDHHTEGGNDPRLRMSANEIMIVHADGMITQYAHLRHQGVKVKVGDQVKAGQVIGLSGNTGYSTYAHLHFAVLKSDNGTNYMSVPFQLPAGVPRERISYFGRR